MSDLDARYGRRTPRRWVWPVIAVVGIAAAVAWAAWVAFQPRPVHGVLWAYEVLDDHRVQVLHPTEAGAKVLAAAQTSRLAAYQERLKDWSADDLAGFAAYLLRYNAEGTGGLPDPRR